MDEAKTLVNLAISAMLSALLISACIGLLSIGYMLWSAFSKQDMANDKLANYVNYTAFDNTVVRGQEIIQLIEKRDDIFILVYDGNSDSNVTNIHDMTVYSKPLLAVANTEHNQYVETTLENLPDSSITTLNNVTGLMDTKQVGYLLNYAKTRIYADLFFNEASSREKLINSFTKSNELGLPCLAGQPDPNSYAAFLSMLVYDVDSTTDIIGVVFVRQTPYITDFD